MFNEKPTTSTNCGEYSITWKNVEGFVNGNPVIKMNKGLKVPMWFYIVAEMLFGRN